jgi:uncharacterized coiled-coil DUF342 family protein
MSEEISFSSILEDATPNKHDSKRRTGILNHLQKSLERNHKGASINFSGNTPLGLSPRRGGIEFSVSIPEGKTATGFSKKFSWELNGRGLADVIVHENRSTPTIHGKNDRTSIPIRISIADATAENKVALLRLLGDSDNRVFNYLLAIQNWVLHRDLAEQSGGLSPFAWSILALTHLRSSNLISDPFLADSGTVVEDGERSLDVGLVESTEGVWQGGDQEVESMFKSFLTSLQSLQLPAKKIISLRMPDGVKRKDCDLKAPDIGKVSANKRVPHLWPILDPFDMTKDISESLTLEGAKRILVEAARGGLSSEELFSTVKEDLLAADEDKDLFADLRSRPANEIESDAKELRKKKSLIEAEVDSIKEARQAQIRIVQALRGIVNDTSNLRTEQRKLIPQLGNRRKEMDKLRQQRDDINRKIVLPTKAIEEEIITVYEKLCGTAKSFRYPSPEEEIRLFIYFLELQEMFKAAVISSECHHVLQQLSGQQRAAVKELKSFESETESIKSDALEGITSATELKGNYHEMKDIDRQITKLLRNLNSKRDELREANRELGRLDAWLRIQKKDAKKPSGKQQGSKSGSSDRARQSRAPKVDIKEVKRKAASGESMSLEDFGALLSSGGLSSITADEPQQSRSRRKKSNKKRVGATSGSRGTGRPDLEGRANKRR